MAELDNRRSGGDTRVGHPTSRRTSRLRDDHTNESVSSSTRSTPRAKSGKALLDDSFTSPRTRKRNQRNRAETVVNDKSKRSRSGNTSTSTSSRDRNSVDVVNSDTSTKSSKTKQAEGCLLKKVLSHTYPTSKRIHSPDKKERLRVAEKRSKVEGGENKAERARSSRSDVPSTAPSTSAQPSQNDDSSDDRRRYPLRSQVRLDAKGSLIPLFPPSPVEIALAQGRKPNKPRRNSSTWTLSHSLACDESKPGEPKGKEVETSSPPQLRVTLRRSTRAANNTGSCVSSRRSSRAGKVGVVASWTMSSGQGQGQPQGPSPSTPAAVQGPSTSESEPGPAPRAFGAGSSSGSTHTMRELFEMTAEAEENNEVGRLQALLESRGLPPHLFGALGPRMQHLLNRSMNVGASSKAQQLLTGLQATGDEGQQMQAVIEMCQMLIMGNEDTLTGFPVKDVVPALITLLTMDHNFVMMNHACRALTYMMEALPRSSAVVVDAVPVFLEKLQEIQCMDVAEQSLTALEALSRRHSKSILMARGVSACLKFLDFFSIAAQRAALAVTANCCQNVHVLELGYVSESLPILAARLTRQSDKKCVESICLSFCRLVDSFQNDPVKLQEIASPDLLTNVQQLLIESPPVISSNTFIGVLRMLTIMCGACPNLAHSLLKQNMAETLCYLLTGSSQCGTIIDNVELVTRSPQELYEITCLIGELMPRLPTDGVFTVDSLLERNPGFIEDIVQWQWRDAQGRWLPFSVWDSRLIEAAHINNEPEVTLNPRANTLIINLNTLTQVCEDVGSTHAVRRRVNPAALDNTFNFGGVTSTNGSQPTPRDAELTSEEQELASSFVRALFSTLYEVYSSSAGPAVRYKCLKALLRMVYFSSPDLLKEVLRKEMVASHIAGMLASHDLRIVVGALQMASILMQKLPSVFGVRFMREGVTHEMKLLANTEPAVETPTNFSSCSGSSLSLATNNGSVLQNAGHITPQADSQHMQLKLTEVLTRKRKSKRSGTSVNRSKSKHEEPLTMTDILARTAGAPPRGRLSGASAKTTSFLASLNPARWGRAPVPTPPHPDRHNFFKARIDLAEASLSASPGNSNITAGNKEKIRTWIRETSGKMIDSHFTDQVATADVLSKLTGLISNMNSPDLQNGGLPALQELCDILKQSDISPFEVNHSGLVEALIKFLSNENEREERLRIFLYVFVNLPVTPTGPVNDINTHCLSLLVTKLNNCVSQLEQLPVKVHDLPAGARGGTSALKFFNTHQLKCNLQRHPDCTNLKQWKGGSVKIDPLALVQAIERYLVVRGYGRVRGHDSGDSDDDNTEDDDIDDTLASVVISHGSSRHQLQFLIGDHVLPYNMTVYQAVRQFTNNTDASETDTDSETPLGHSAVWVQTHTIQYRQAPPSSGPSAAPSHRKHKGASKCQRKPDHLWNDGVVPALQSPLTPLLTSKLPESVTIQDASLEVLNLLRVLHAINRYWGTLYRVPTYQQLLPTSAFVNSKIAAKASRQLQDPLVIMTGNLPFWLQQIAVACPFLLPFETRQLLFYATSFDRDRALQRLLDAAPDLTSTDSSERVTPKLDRRKRTISRADILKQAELVIQDLGSSRALLEVQYENEVGTGLGPTLEFYALVSKELQRSDLELWGGGHVEMDDVKYVHSPQGLFPAPLPRAGKVAHTHFTKLKSKFRFLGKLMAKAVMDSRLLDMSLSPVLYRWLLGQEHSLQLPDLLHVSPAVHQVLASMMSGDVKASDVGLDFTLPEFEDIELKKGGKEINVSNENVMQYIELAVHWRLVEGVSRQLEALREGFETVFPVQQLHIFYPEELDSVFCGSQQQSGWDVKSLSECFRPDHGYTLDSRAIRFLLDVLSSYTGEEQRLFLQFVTGSPRLPVGGFKSLSPPLTVVRKDVEGDASADTYLPSVMTCVNYLKLPDYSSVEVMRSRLALAAREGSHSFHLS